MTSRSAGPSFKNTVNVSVPSGCRPRLGAAPKPFSQIERNVELAWIETTKDLRQELVDQIHALIHAAQRDGECYDQFTRCELLRCANNIRGMAEADGSELTADIAHAIYCIIENASSVEVLPKVTMRVLAEGCFKVVGFDRRSKDGALALDVQRMLRMAIASVKT